MGALQTIKGTFRPLYRPIMDWYRKPKRYRYLFKEIRRLEPKNILEIGTWNGNRAVQMIECAQKYSQKKEGIHYYGMDMFEGLTDEQFMYEISKRPPPEDEVRQKLEQTGARVTLIKGNTTKLPEETWESLPKMDFVFIDGGHSRGTVQNDWDHVKEYMHKGTVVIFDDYWLDNAEESAKPVVDAIDCSEYKVEILPRIDSFKKEWGVQRIQFAKVTKNT